jgi:Ca-activated chloride channel family protein
MAANKQWMTFFWPEMLWLFVLVPLLVLTYIWILRRKKRTASRYASLSLVREAMGNAGRVRRHLPPVLFLLALAALILATARPHAVVTLPSTHETIILAMDVSGSMRATDVEPSRIAAAQAAAKTFVEEQPRNVKIGIVSFAGTAAVVQAPTENREDLVSAIDRFQLQRGTAIGSGIIVSLALLFPRSGIDVETLAYGRSAPRPNPQRDAEKKEFKPVPPGSYTSAAIILLSDGQRTTGPDHMEAAKMAAERGVRIYTVGIGTVNGTTLGFEGWSMRVRLDEDALKGIANATHGEYFYAGTATDLKKIYQGLNARFVLEKRETEVSAFFAAAGAILALLAATLSLLWFNRIL